MMTGPFLIAAAWTIRSSAAFVVPTGKTTAFTIGKRLFASEPSSVSIAVESCVSRLATLQTLLSKHGAPGSQGCTEANDLVPVASSSQDTPELVASMVGGVAASDEDIDKFCNIHPYLFPIAESQKSGNILCAYRNPMTEASNKNHPWPIVETKIGAPGFQLLALNSEHLMRRIICECDGAEKNPELIKMYNEGLGQGLLKEKALDAPYEEGSVAKLGYGVDKYVLLRVGPFQDLYEKMSREHYSRGDEQSALIAAEAANGKLAGFGSTFRFYARLLSSFPNREEECRDAARMCLRLPLSTIGLDYHDFEEVAMLGLMADEHATQDVAIQKIQDMYDLMKQVESEEDQTSSGRTPEQIVIEEATEMLDRAVLAKKPWKDVRKELAEHYQKAGKDDEAYFVSYFSR